jgi:CRP-like cAMP-binding protein
VRAGEVLVTAGDPLEALVVVEDGELTLGTRRIGAGEVVDELACVAPQAVADDLRAVRAGRVIRLERADFEELVDDVPGLAAAICRALGERARRADVRDYESPLVTVK